MEAHLILTELAGGWVPLLSFNRWGKGGSENWSGVIQFSYRAGAPPQDGLPLNNAASVLLQKPGFSKIPTETAEMMGKPDSIRLHRKTSECQYLHFKILHDFLNKVNRRVCKIKSSFYCQKGLLFNKPASGPRWLCDSIVGEVWNLHERPKARDTLRNALTTKNH